MIGPFVSPGSTMLEVTELKEELRIEPHVVGYAEGGLPHVRLLPPRWRP